MFDVSRFFVPSFCNLIQLLKAFQTAPKKDLRQADGTTKIGLASFRPHVDNRADILPSTIIKGKPGRKPIVRSYYLFREHVTN